MKKNYLKPSLKVVTIKQDGHILNGSNPYQGGTSTNAGLKGPVGGSTEARSRQEGFSDWDEE